jgi:uncharacterized protein (DUF1778 family)
MSSSQEPERHTARRDAKTGGQVPSRPRSESRQRTVLVAVRLLPQERDVLAKTARSRGVTLSEFIRASAIRSASAPAAEAEARLPLRPLLSQALPARRAASTPSRRPQDGDLPIPGRALASQASPTVIQTAPAAHKTRPTGPGLTWRLVVAGDGFEPS